MYFKMDRKYVIRRRVVFGLLVALITGLFTYATHDVCFVGTDKDYANFLGYGSCEKMMDDFFENGLNK